MTVSPTQTFTSEATGSLPSYFAPQTLVINTVDSTTHEKILRFALQVKCRDIYLCSNDYVRGRIDNRKVILSNRAITHSELTAIMTSMSSRDQIDRLYQSRDANGRYLLQDIENKNKYRGFRYSYTKHTIPTGAAFNAAIRPIPEYAPTIDEVGIGEELTAPLLSIWKGLILFVGATGEGKSSSLAAMIRFILERESHMRILEWARPPEFSYHNINTHPSNQIIHHAISEDGQSGGDLLSYELANAVSMRQAGDWYAVGEMTEKASFNSAVTLANTGHIVSSTLHANSAAATFDRVALMYPPEERQNVLQNLIREGELFVAQKLLERKSGGLIACREILELTKDVKQELKACQTVGDTVDKANEILKRNKLDFVSQAKQLLENDLITQQVYETFVRRL